MNIIPITAGVLMGALGTFLSFLIENYFKSRNKIASVWVYKKDENGRYLIGFYNGMNDFCVTHTTCNETIAIANCHYLNGGDEEFN